MTYRIAAPVEEVPKPRRQVDPLKLIAITGVVLMLVLVIILAQDDPSYWNLLFFGVTSNSPFLLLLCLD